MDSERHRTTDGNRNARALLETAIELDPESAPAYVGLGQTYLNQVSLGWTEFPQKALEQVEPLAGKALRLKEFNADAYALLGMVNIYRQRYDRAVNQLDRAIELNPNNAAAVRLDCRQPSVVFGSKRQPQTDPKSMNQMKIPKQVPHGGGNHEQSGNVPSTFQR